MLAIDPDRPLFQEFVDRASELVAELAPRIGPAYATQPLIIPGDEPRLLPKEAVAVVGIDIFDVAEECRKRHIRISNLMPAGWLGEDEVYEEWLPWGTVVVWWGKDWRDVLDREIREHYEEALWAYEDRRRPDLAPGLLVGGYELVKQIGQGGNGLVWSAKGPSGTRAYKFLLADSVDSEKYRRFRREVETLQRLRGSSYAILPIFDSELPDAPNRDLAWFSMPLAVTLDAALKGAPFAMKVRAMSDLARTLAALERDETLHHRDIKPANLYEYEGRFVVGDFGLVKRLDPKDESLTRTNHVPGPKNYMPPEAFLRPAEAAEGPIDVYCFAKTLWAVSAEEIGPPGGQIRADDRWALGRVVHDERAHELDELIEAGTSNAPDVRPTMASFADELRRFLG